MKKAQLRWLRDQTLAECLAETRELLGLCWNEEEGWADVRGGDRLWELALSLQGKVGLLLATMNNRIKYPEMVLDVINELKDGEWSGSWNIEMIEEWEIRMYQKVFKLHNWVGRKIDSFVHDWSLEGGFRRDKDRGVEA